MCVRKCSTETDASGTQVCENVVTKQVLVILSVKCDDETSPRDIDMCEFSDETSPCDTEVCESVAIKPVLVTLRV